jgi:hypothetical protein
MQLPVAITSVLDAALEHLYGLKPLIEPTVVLGTDAARIWQRNARIFTTRSLLTIVSCLVESFLS